MKILYIARHNPTLIDLASSVDHFFYHAFQENGFEIRVLGPFKEPAILIERIINRTYSKLTGKNYLKFKMSTVWRASQATNYVVRDWEPDVIFTIFPSPLVFFSGASPCILRLDTTFYGQESNYPKYGKLATKISIWQENQAFSKCTKIITTSHWSKNILEHIYNVPSPKIIVSPNPAALPKQSIPKRIDLSDAKRINIPFRLLLVGRDYRRKGIDIAIEVVQQLNQIGYTSELIVCGLQGKDNSFIKFVGPYKKSIPQELEQYTDLYRWANLLIHPALFEPAGIVPSEAAAFGTPTITNNVGGLATVVENNKTGIVLPGGSPAKAYVDSIIHLINNPEIYNELCQGARARFECELNWEAYGRFLSNILIQTANSTVV